MPGITNPAEEYFKDGLWGWAATLWEKLISSGGRLFTALHGWDGAAWRKLPLLWGYSDRLAVHIAFTAEGAGDATGNVFTVPEGYVYVLQVVNVYHSAAAAQLIQVYITDGANPAYLIQEAAAVPQIFYNWNGKVVLKKDDVLGAWTGAPGDGKQIVVYSWGYKMKIAE